MKQFERLEVIEEPLSVQQQYKLAVMADKGRSEEVRDAALLLLRKSLTPPFYVQLTAPDDP